MLNLFEVEKTNTKGIFYVGHVHGIKIGFKKKKIKYAMGILPNKQ